MKVKEKDFDEDEKAEEEGKRKKQVGKIATKGTSFTCGGSEE